MACLKAEAAAQATIAKAQGFGGGGGGASTGWTHGAPAATAADLTLISYKRALLVACFGRWGGRLAYRRQLGVEREGAEARLAAGRWEAEAVAERATTAQLRAALADAETQAARRRRASELEGALARSEAARAAQRKRLFATADGARSLEAQLREIIGAQRALGEEAAAAATEADEADETSSERQAGCAVGERRAPQRRLRRRRSRPAARGATATAAVRIKSRSFLLR